MRFVSEYAGDRRAYPVAAILLIGVMSQGDEVVGCLTVHLIDHRVAIVEVAAAAFFDIKGQHRLTLGSHRLIHRMHSLKVGIG